MGFSKRIKNRIKLYENEINKCLEKNDVIKAMLLIELLNELEKAIGKEKTNIESIMEGMK